jgi:hypothetical protein
MAVLLGIGLALLLNTKTVAGDVQLQEIKTRTDVYQNVTVTGHNETDVFITHSRGMANVKIKDLDAETLWRVGLGPEPGSPEAVAAAEAAANEGNKMPAALAKMFESSSAPVMESDMEAQVVGTSAAAGSSGANPFSSLPESAQMQEALASLQSSLPILIGMIVGALLFYLFWCFCLKLIVEKTGNKAGIMIWLPILQFFPALRAANMSGWWLGFPLLTILLVMAAGAALMTTVGPSPVLLALLIPYAIATIVLFVGEIMWCIKIVNARGKSGWFAAFMVIWLLSPLATPLGFISETLFSICYLASFVLAVFSFLYLAFSSSDNDGEVEAAGDDGKIVIHSAFSEA